MQMPIMAKDVFMGGFIALGPAVVKRQKPGGAGNAAGTKRFR